MHAGLGIAADLKSLRPLRRVHKSPYLAVVRMEPSVFINRAQGPCAVAFVVFSSGLFRREREAPQRLLHAWCRLEHVRECPVPGTSVRIDARQVALTMAGWQRNGMQRGGPPAKLRQ